MLKHHFFTNFSAVPLTSFFAIAKRLSTPGHTTKIAFIKNLGKVQDVALSQRKVKTA